MDYRDHCGQIFNSGFIQLEPILNVFILILQQPSKKRISYLLNKSPGTLPRLLFFVFLYPIAFYFLFSGFSCIVTFPNTNCLRLSSTIVQQPYLLSRLLCILQHPESLSQWRVKLFSSPLLFFGYEERSYLRLYANSLLLTYAIREAHFHSLAFIFMPAESIAILRIISYEFFCTLLPPWLLYLI